MFILTLDTSCSTCSVAVANNQSVLAYVVEEEKHKQAERLLKMMEQALELAGADYRDLGLIALTNGPGSFTGIRIGLATAYGVHLGMGTKMIAISTLEAMAQEICHSSVCWNPELSSRGLTTGSSVILDSAVKPHYDSRVLIALAAGRRQYYVQEFAADARGLAEPALWDEAQLLAYDGDIAGNFLLPGRSVQQLAPNAWQVAAYVIHNHATVLEARRQHLPPPLYIREHDAVKPKIL